MPPRPRTRASRRRAAAPLALAPFAAALLASGCVESISTGPRDGLPEARGAFEGTWDVERLDLVTEESAIESCGGSLEIDAQAPDGDLAGSFLIRAAGECAERAGSVKGEVREGGALVLLLDVPGGSDNDFEDLSGCVFQVGGNAFGGALDGDALAATATFLGECEGALSQVTIRFAGER